MVECSGLLNRRPARVREFESRPLRFHLAEVNEGGLYINILPILDR